MTEDSPYDGGDLNQGSTIPENVLRVWKDRALVFDRAAALGSPVLEEGLYWFEVVFQGEMPA